MSAQVDESTDPFDAVLGLEEEFFQKGYKLGLTDGERAGRIEGRAFGLEKGFEKYMAMGRLNGKAQVWAGKLNFTTESDKEQQTAQETKDTSLESNNM